MEPSLVNIAETGGTKEMQIYHAHSGKFYREGIGALYHNNKHTERVLLGDFKY
jgi:hypothetical protein